MSGGRWRVSGRALGDERGTLEGEREGAGG